ncbi:MAG: pyruvate, phosphate dikinase [Treponema sp.]|jgi:pyruvate,orthophosphate dikinase|nr:pyruvate, phosphate dikinase [Treponema sp.]
MDSRIHFFSQIDVIPGSVPGKLLGLRGRQANEFAEMGFPILPGFVIDTSLASEFEKIGTKEIRKDIAALLAKCGGIAGKEYGDKDNPMLLKIVISPNLAVSAYPALHNYGLVRETVPGFVNWVGGEFAAHEVLFMIRGMLKIEERIKELEAKSKEQQEIAGRLKVLDRMLGFKGPSNELGGQEGPDGAAGKTAEEYMDEYAGYFPAGFFDSAEDQFVLALKEISRLLAMDDQNDRDTALLIQPMVYGNYGKNSAAGDYYSRNIVTGEKKLQGKFYRQNFNEIGAAGQDIGKIGDEKLKELEKIAWALEDKFREIRYIRFCVENGKLWLIEQRPVDQKSTQADIKLLLDLAKRKVVDNASVVKAIDPARLNEILHPVIDTPSAKGLKSWKGGIAGAPGAAIGRAYFSTEALLEARKLSLKKGKAERFVLVLASSFAEDVKAIEVSDGVLTAEGGYSAHASVVARQYGKVSLVAPELKITRGGISQAGGSRAKGSKKKAVLGDIAFSEGDYITLNVPYYGESSVYLGSAKLIEPNPGASGLLEFISLARTFHKGFHVRANAETARDAALALSFGADGIGLCRTEHMFFGAGRINVFREMILSPSKQAREKALKKLQAMQQQDFYGILKVMAGREVTIRLLDAPFHEFMPHTEDELNSYIAYASAAKKQKLSKAEVLAAIDALNEFNPMLGHRGCRIAVSYPEIYAMQVRAIFGAAYKLRSEKTDVRLEIMVPVVMNEQELKLIAFGKKIEGSSYAGIVDIEENFRLEQKARAVPYSIGTMIELPAAALGAGEIAKYGRFFSFGTNDLTQTTLGISRDDFTSFMPDYTLYDLIDGNPFSTLDPRVKDIIAIAVERGRLTRPDLVCGLCGEHGANPANVRFCMDAGLDYVSCSPYSVPIALLAVAQAELEKSENDRPDG